MALIYNLTEQLFVSSQLDEDDIMKIVSLGVKLVICNRPDSELSAAQPDHNTMQDLLENYGIVLIYQPIENLSMPDIEQFVSLLDNTTSPVLAYCLSGTRCIMLWAAGELIIKKTPRDEVVCLAAQVGCDLSQFLLD